MNLLIILLIVFVVLLLFSGIGLYVFKKFFTKKIHNTLIKKPILMVDNYNEKINRNLLPKSEVGIRYTIAFWIRFVNMGSNENWRNYTRPKGIISRFNSPSIYYLPDKHILQILVGYKGESEIIEKYTFEIPDLKIQKWQHIALTVDNKNVSVYVNGVLTKSILLPNTPFLADKPMYVGQMNNNFNGYLSHLEYWNHVLDLGEISEIYKKNANSLSNDLISYNQYFLNKNSKK